MHETRTRSLIKALTWRVIGMFVLGSLAWIITNNTFQTTTLTVSFHLVQFTLYYFHERIWNYIKWGVTDGQKKET